MIYIYIYIYGYGGYGHGEYYSNGRLWVQRKMTWRFGAAVRQSSWRFHPFEKYVVLVCILIYW